ncbi:toxin-activating lysine-acyltransferase [uncultured Herbaspirillum sp.]|uniref:toxin-activating lysine-acyltransferase n=1 Tax=uncultured Herbaspirillum sp. TaxID=160236 RepID=UPI0025912A8B|nr:toxin-activating lysine-acyltransferase [uncultured Herbaspirillum sp.]MCP1571950.1 hemolysin-activating ACP:hemolysin acyltransferase [Herbaspirillum rubrisubalbicans]
MIHTDGLAAPSPAVFEQWMADFGDVLALAQRSKVQAHYPLAILRARIFPSLWTHQYLILRKQGKAVAFINWAWLSEELSERYRHSQCYIAPEQWNSGHCLWFMEMLGSEYLGELLLGLRKIIPRDTLAHWHEIKEIGAHSGRVRTASFGPFAKSTEPSD